MQEKHFAEEDRLFVLHWMQKYCYGRENARRREDPTNPDKGILPYMPKSIPDRKWRRIISELISEGHVYSSASFGYFFMPLVNPSDLDIEAGLQALAERKAKAISTIKNCDKNFHKLKAINQGQKVFA